MQALIDDVRSVFEDVWNSVLESPMQEAPWAEERVGQEPFLSAWVCFSVGWEGVLHLTCSLELAKQVAAALFGGDSGERSIEDAADALGELANMVGGNIKSLLPKPCFISIPESAQGGNDGAVTEGREIDTELSFVNGSLQLRLRLLRNLDPSPSGSR